MVSVIDYSLFVLEIFCSLERGIALAKQSHQVTIAISFVVVVLKNKIGLILICVYQATLREASVLLEKKAIVSHGT